MIPGISESSESKFCNPIFFEGFFCSSLTLISRSTATRICFFQFIVVFAGVVWTQPEITGHQNPSETIRIDAKGSLDSCLTA